MPAKIEKYSHLARRIMDGTLDLDAGDLMVMLVDSTYTFSAGHATKADITGEITGDGYAAGGKSIPSPAVSFVADTSTATWAAGTAYKYGDIRRPSTANGHVYVCVVGGTSGSTEPAWPTEDNGSVSDGTVTWVESGAGYASFNAGDVVWPDATLTARRAIAYRSGLHGGLQDPLVFSVLLDDTPADVSVSNVNFTLQWPTSGIMVM